MPKRRLRAPFLIPQLESDGLSERLVRMEREAARRASTLSGSPRRPRPWQFPHFPQFPLPGWLIVAAASRFIQISASIQPGNSGGPVLDEAGRLVGVIESKLDPLKVVRATGDIPQNVNSAIRATTLANFLEINRITYEVAANTATLPNTQLAEQAQAASVQLECRK